MALSKVHRGDDISGARLRRMRVLGQTTGRAADPHSPAASSGGLATSWGVRHAGFLGSSCLHLLLGQQCHHRHYLLLFFSLSRALLTLDEA